MPSRNVDDVVIAGTSSASANSRRRAPIVGAVGLRINHVCEGKVVVGLERALMVVVVLVIVVVVEAAGTICSDRGHCGKPGVSLVQA